MTDNCPICQKSFKMRDVLHTFCSKACKKTGAKLRKDNDPNQPMVKWATRWAMIEFNQELRK